MGGAENVDYNSHSHNDANVSIVGSHVWVHVLQLPRAGQATHTPAYFRWTRTLAIVGKHVLQLCTSHHSYVYSARGGQKAAKGGPVFGKTIRCAGLESFKQLRRPDTSREEHCQKEVAKVCGDREARMSNPTLVEPVCKQQSASCTEAG